MSSNQDYPIAASDAARAAGSWVPIVVALVSGVLVIGLLASIMMTPAKSNAVGMVPAGNQAATNGQNAPPVGVKVGATAPDFVLNTLDGKSVQLSSFRGVKPVWINFWATWCPHCKVEMPQMQQLYNQNQGRGLEILGVDDMEDASWVQPYIDNNKYTWNFVLDNKGAVDAAYHVTGLPTHIFIGQDGVIKNIVIGSIEQPTMESSLKLIMGP